DYQKKYDIVSAPQMSGIRSLLLTDGPNTALPADQQHALANVTSQLLPDYRASLEPVLNSLQNGTRLPASAYDRLDQKYTALSAGWNDVQQKATEVTRIVSANGSSQAIILTIVIAFASTIVLVITIGYFVNLTITRPLRQLASLTRRIAKGETNARADISGRDEIYMVATSMNSMLDNIVRLIQETQSQRDVLQSQVEKLVSEVSGIGDGDLRVQAEVTSDALGVLADSFNYMVEELGSLVVRVKVVANEVDRSTSSTLDRMTQLVETEDTQLKEISEAMTEIDRMSAWSRQVAERSQVLHNVARDAREDAHVGRGAVKQAVEGMGRINENVQATADKVQALGEHSREINDIVELMSAIAHQTNRLALDAAIQAAMAGENGKGFGAVAADIRRLAERAKDQAGIITRIVRSVREDISAVALSMQDTERETSNGAKLTQEAGEALESIFSAVERQAHEIENINQVATQQLQSSSAVVRIMHSVSETTQQSSISTRDASQNMERLARLVEQLHSSVEAFKLREGHNLSIPYNNATDRSPEGDPENSMSVSNMFRAVSGTAQPILQSGFGMDANMLLPDARQDPRSFYPMPTNQQNGKNENWSDWASSPQAPNAPLMPGASWPDWNMPKAEVDQWFESQANNPTKR
ncbi:MAG: HAMP domain-containing protein, partial [Chloroflexi bacterium]